MIQETQTSNRERYLQKNSMLNITVCSDQYPNIMKLSFNNTLGVVTVGQQEFQFDLESLWDLAKTAVLSSTNNSLGMYRRKLEATAANNVGIRAICEMCLPQYAAATKKMLILSSEPSITVWVCGSCATIHGADKTNIVGDPDTIERLWEEEEIRRDKIAGMEEDEQEANL